MVKGGPLKLPCAVTKKGHANPMEGKPEFYKQSMKLN